MLYPSLCSQRRPPSLLHLRLFTIRSTLEMLSRFVLPSYASRRELISSHIDSTWCHRVSRLHTNINLAIKAAQSERRNILTYACKYKHKHVTDYDIVGLYM